MPLYFDKERVDIKVSNIYALNPYRRLEWLCLGSGSPNVPCNNVCMYKSFYRIGYEDAASVLIRLIVMHVSPNL